MGMHVLGLRDIVMKRSDVETDGFDIVEVIRYLCRGEKPIDDGHVIADLNGPRFQAFTQDRRRDLAGKSHAQSLRTFEAGEHAGYRRDQLKGSNVRTGIRLILRRAEQQAGVDRRHFALGVPILGPARRARHIFSTGSRRCVGGNRSRR